MQGKCLKFKGGLPGIARNFLSPKPNKHIAVSALPQKREAKINKQRAEKTPCGLKTQMAQSNKSRARPGNENKRRSSSNDSAIKQKAGHEDSRLKEHHPPVPRMQKATENTKAGCDDQEKRQGSLKTNWTPRKAAEDCCHNHDSNTTHPNNVITVLLITARVAEVISMMPIIVVLENKLKL